MTDPVQDTRTTTPFTTAFVDDYRHLGLQAGLGGNYGLNAMICVDRILLRERASINGMVSGLISA